MGLKVEEHVSGKVCHPKLTWNKAQRMEIPSDMPWQIQMVKEVVNDAFNIPMIEMHGYEDKIIQILSILLLIFRPAKRGICFDKGL